MQDDVSKILDVNFYRKKFAFRNFHDILEIDLVKEIMWGFLNIANTGVAYLYSIINEGCREEIRQESSFSFYGNRAHTMHNSVCEVYSKRTEGTLEHREKCRECDETHYRDCINSANEKVHTYFCWLGFKEYACPIKVDGRIRAIILTGQLIDTENEDEIEKIKENIKRSGIDSSIQDDMLENLELEIIRQKNRPYAPDEKKLKTSLEEVQKTLHNIIDKLVDNEYKRIADELLRDSVEILSHLNPHSFKEWWTDCGKLIDSFAQIADLDDVQFFMRYSARYKMEWQLKQEDSQQIHIKSRFILKTIPNNVMANIDPDILKYKSLVENLSLLGDPKLVEKLRSKQVYLYRYDISYSETATSNLFLIILSEKTSQKVLLLTREFLKLVSIHTAIMNLISGMHASQESFKKKVGIVAHSLRTPLQSIYLSLDKMSGMITNEAGVDFNRIIENAMERLYNANENMTYLLEKAKNSKDLFSIVRLTEECYQNLKTYSESRSCILRLFRPDSPDINVYGDRVYIGIALTNVVENAIKYSWAGEKRDYKVTIRFSLIDNYVRITVKNYGIGIPADKIEALQKQTEPGYRANIVDKHERADGKRDGTGWGLPITVKILKENKGWLEIESTPADNDFRSEENEYHRYITYFHIYLPRIL